MTGRLICTKGGRVFLVNVYEDLTCPEHLTRWDFVNGNGIGIIQCCC